MIESIFMSERFQIFPVRFKLFFLIYIFLKYPTKQWDIEMEYLNVEEAVKG